MALCSAAVSVGAHGCATIPRNRYGVASVGIEGMRDLDEDALRACLATHERPSFQVQVGATSDLTCGEPPFDATRYRLFGVRWPWTDWPLFDRAVFDRDLDRVERWFRARGYYDARVRASRLDPESAAVSDRIEDGLETCHRESPREGCTVAVRLSVFEGEPIHVRSVEIAVTLALREGLPARLEQTIGLHPGDRFDEAAYDQAKARLVRMLANASYAGAEVTGRVDIDRAGHFADIRFSIVPGPACVFGNIRVIGQRDLPVEPILAAALLSPGGPFSQDDLEQAQRSIYGLGAFSSVEIEPRPRSGREHNEIDVLIRVTPGRLTRLGFGAGIESGSYGQEAEQRRWDLHLLGVAEHRNLFGGLQRARLEWRPKLVFETVLSQWWSDAAAWAFGPADRPVEPQIGSDVRVEFRQPSFLERSTSLVFGGRWDLGPDPILSTAEATPRPVFRHDISASLGPERSFLDGRLQLGLRLWANLFLVTNDTRARDATLVTDYHTTFLEPTATLDLRDDPRSARRGWFFRTTFQSAGFVLPSSWDYLRATGDGRAYIPLPLRAVLAMRLAGAAMFVMDADARLDADSRDLGPTSYRLTGGGSTSNRGYLPGRLGDSAVGGIRRWEASTELRVPLTMNFGFAIFVDAGDVHRGPSFRLDHPNTSAGLSLRYVTFIGPLRFDAGWQIPEAQVVGQRDPPAPHAVDFGFFRFDGAVNLTIGEAY